MTTATDAGAVEGRDASKPSDRRRQRQAQIIDAAERLFAERGFHGTGIDDIGEAVGISGPAIYKHFAGKDALLLAVLDRVWFGLRDGLDAIVGMEPAPALDVLVRQHLDLAVHHPGSISVLVQELRHLPEEYLERAARHDERLVDAWAEQLVKLRVHLGLEEARVAARALQALISSLAADRRGHLDDERKRALIMQMVDGAIDLL